MRIPALHRELVDVDDLPEAERRYPVIVTVTNEHVVWVEGYCPDDALENLKNDGEWYERIRDQETLASFWQDYRKPGDEHHSLDWDTVMNGEPYGGSYPGMRCDAHVEAWRHEIARVKWEAEKAACVEAGHPKREPSLIAGEVWCPTCGRLPRPQPAAEETQRV